jgi:pimeloyl-ACP methyl ester carboxylesterase
LGHSRAAAIPIQTRRFFEVAPRPVPTVDAFLFLFFGRSEAAREAGRQFWKRRHLREDQDPPSSAELMQGQIAANTAFVAPLAAEHPFAHQGEIISQSTLVVNGVDDVMISTINSWHIVQNIPNAQLIVYPDAGHGAQFQYPERFLNHAIQFLDE